MRTLTTEDIAARCGVTRQAIHQRAKSRGVTPKRIDGRCAWTPAQARALAKPGKPGPKEKR